MESREEALLEEYYKTLHIEALTMADMAREEILPACTTFQNELAQTARNKKEVGVSNTMEVDLLRKVCGLTEELYRKCGELSDAIAQAPQADAKRLSNYYHDMVIPIMNAVRQPADDLELLVGKKYWPFPTYSDILFYV